MSDPPLVVTVTCEAGVCVAADAITTVYGAGQNRADALHDYLANVEQERAALEVDEAILGDTLRAELAALRALWENQP